MSHLSHEARSRFFPNELPDWPGAGDHHAAHFPPAALVRLLRKQTDRMVEVIQDDWPADLNTQNNPTVYEGAAGAAMMFLKLWESKYELPDRTDPLERAAEYIDLAVKLVEHKNKQTHGNIGGISFILGDAGVYALAAVINHHLGHRNKEQGFVERLCNLSTSFMPVSARRLDWEPFNGLTGYLYSIFFVEKHLEREIAPKCVGELIDKCIESGMAAAALAREEGDSNAPPLLYKWLGEKYLGLAHGIAGILHILLLRPDELDRALVEGREKPEHRKAVTDALDWILGIRFRDSKNYPALIDDTDDHLVHWCHGAPGIGLLFCQAYRVFTQQRYLEAALNAGEVVWQRGLLKKGLGLCHGISGNAYLFLELFKITDDHKHLWRAWQFAEFAVGPEGEKLWNVPSQPYSLFLGLSGMVCLAADLCMIGDGNDKDAIARAGFPGCSL